MVLVEVYLQMNEIDYEDDCLLEKVLPGEKDNETIVKFSTKRNGKFVSGEAIMIKVEKDFECKSVIFLDE